MDQNGPLQAKMDQNGPFWSREYQNPVRNKAILTKMVKTTILDHIGPVHFPTVPWPFPKFAGAILVVDVYISACLLAFECAISCVLSACEA